FQPARTKTPRQCLTRSTSLSSEPQASTTETYHLNPRTVMKIPLNAVLTLTVLSINSPATVTLNYVALTKGGQIIANSITVLGSINNTSTTQNVQLQA